MAIGAAEAAQVRHDDVELALQPLEHPVLVPPAPGPAVQQHARDAPRRGGRSAAGSRRPARTARSPRPDRRDRSREVRPPRVGDGRVGEDVDERGAARRERPLERGPQLARRPDQLAVAAERLHDLVVARLRPQVGDDRVAVDGTPSGASPDPRCRCCRRCRRRARRGARACPTPCR